MCGIVGFIKLGTSQTPIDVSDMQLGLQESMSRGKEATGFYSERIGVVKEAIDAIDFNKKYDDKIAEAVKGKMFLGHTRASTGGASPKFNDNNHPHEGKRYVLIHNGVFGNLPRVKDYPYKGTCDSEIALSYIETFGIDKGLSLFSEDDGFALVIYDKETKYVYFVRHKNPMVFSYSSLTKAFYFGSTTDIVIQAVPRADVGGFGMIAGSAPQALTEDKLLTLDTKVNKFSMGKEKICFRRFLYALEDNKQVALMLLIDEYKKENRFGVYAISEKKATTVASRTPSSVSSVAPHAHVMRGVERFFLLVNQDGIAFQQASLT